MNREERFTKLKEKRKEELMKRGKILTNLEKGCEECKHLRIRENTVDNTKFFECSSGIIAPLTHIINCKKWDTGEKDEEESE